jgi:tripartite-type tricarboxylate transporter receptor subunit TctC
MSRFSKILRGVAVAALVAVLLPAVAFAEGQAEGEVEEDYPTREIEIMVPWSAGGGTDTMFRTFASVVPKYLGTAIIIDNQPGGATVPAYTNALKREGTGYYYLAWNNASITVTHMRETPFDASSFVPVINLVQSPVVLVVADDSPYQSLDDLVEDVRSNPGEVSLGNGGHGGGQHIIALAFEDEFDLEFNHVPHDGGGPAVTAAMGGHVDAAAVGPSEVVSQIRAGDLRCLAVLAEERLEILPDQPTAKEQGMDFAMTQWRGLAAPKGTPEEYIQHVHDAFKATMEDETFQTLAKKAGLILKYMGPEEFAEHVQAQDKVFEQLMRRKGLGEKY